MIKVILEYVDYDTDHGSIVLRNVEMYLTPEEYEQTLAEGQAAIFIDYRV